MPTTSSLLAPSSVEEAVPLFAAEPSVTIVGGGTLIVPDLALGRTAVDRALWLGRAGLNGITQGNGTVTIGAMTSLAACADVAAPIGPCTANIGDGEVRAQATIGGNICAPTPYGDLRGPLLALEATVRSAGADGETTEDAATFFATTDKRIVLDVTVTVPAAGSFVPLRLHHTQSLTPIGISAARASDGTVRLAATGVAPDARRLPSAEAALAGGASAADAADAAGDDIEPYDDVLASAAYRRRVLPSLIRRALDQLGG